MIAFDHNLKLLWEVDVAEKFPHHSHIKEVSGVCGGGGRKLCSMVQSSRGGRGLHRVALRYAFL